MASADRSTKDKAMAANLKRAGEERTHMRCPMCHGMVYGGSSGAKGMLNLGHALYAHLSKHAGSSGKGV